MFFILSKILFFLLSPGLWIVALLLIAYLKRRKPYAKKLAGLAAILFILFSNQFLYKKVLFAWQVNETNMDPNKVYTGILLGGMVHFDKNLRPNFNYSADRFIQTLKLYNQNKISKIILAAGSGSLIRPELNEAAVLKRELVENGVPDSIIIVDSTSRNTSENAKNVKKLIDSLHLQPPFLLITSARHMRRSDAVFRHEGITTAFYPSALDVGNDGFDWNDIIPQIYVLAGWEQVFKEMTGLIAYKLAGKA